MTRRRRANELANDPSPFGSAKPSSFGGNYRGVLFPSIDDRVFCLITQYKTGNYLTASCCQERGHQLPSKFFPFHAILSTQIFRQFEIVKRVLPSSSNCGIKKAESRGGRSLLFKGKLELQRLPNTKFDAMP